MPAIKPKVRVIKVPKKSKDIDRPQVFPKMPILYLELLENKDKVKPEFRNKTYKPQKSQDLSNENSPQLKVVKEELSLEARLDRIIDDKNDNGKDDDKKSVSSDSSKSSDDTHKDDDYIKEKVKSTDNLANRLSELLDDNNSIISVAASPDIKRSASKYSRSIQKSVDVRSLRAPVQDRQYPPTLEEIEAQGGIKRNPEMRNIAHTSYSEQEEEDLKREYMYKIQILKKSYPAANFTNVDNLNIHTDLEFMKKEYDATVRSLSLDSTVENWKTWLMYGFVATEFIMGKFLHLDMEGFAAQQMLNINKYDKLLIELGEKSYLKGPSKLPVELRLLLMIITQAGFFLLTKMLMKKTGTDLMGMVNNLANPQQTNAAKKRKMKGPSVGVDDLPDV